MNKNEINQTIARVASYCASRNLRFTPIRQEVLELVLQYPEVVKAYEILADLRRIRANAEPPTVYRALDFFVEIGVLHRAEALNGFVFCPHFDRPHMSIILSCSQCGNVNEINAIEMVQSMHDFCRTQDFTLQKEPVVFTGLCEGCRDALFN